MLRALGETTRTFDADSTAAFLVVIEEGTSWRHRLSDQHGALAIGRGDDCAIHLGDPAASRKHAELRLADGKASLVDLGSHNGTHVNGERLLGERVLAPGDVITICNTTLAYHAPPRRRPAPRALSVEAFHEHASGELDRALASGRRLGILIVHSRTARSPESLGPALRRHDVLAVDGNRILVAFPEVDSAELDARASAIHAALPDTQTGGAIAPDDGTSLAILVAAARDALALAAPGGHANATHTVRRVELGATTIMLAEPSMLRLYALVERLAPSDLPILVLGETGVGKESVAAAIHDRSPRRAHSFIAVNCAALPETLAESVLFGHERGAFSGALTTQIGQFEAADKGTLFLDEVGELSLAIQAKLLRALDSKTIQRLGATREQKVDVRVVAATNRDLRAEVAAGRFREDLYFRLGGAVVRVPPLRERPRELLVLARELLARASERLGREVPAIGVRAMETLARHPWPGNVRELRHAMEYVAASIDGDEVETWHLPPSIADEPSAEPEAAPATLATAIVSQGVSSGASGASGASAVTAAPSSPSRFRPIAEEVRELERRRMIQALTVTGGVQTRAADLLRMPRRTFVGKMRDYGLHELFGRDS